MEERGMEEWDRHTANGALKGIRKRTVRVLNLWAKNV